MNNPNDTLDPELDAFEQKWRRVLHQSLPPSGEEMLALYSGALDKAEAERLRERIRTSPRALRNYAAMTERTVAEVKAELQPEPTIVEMAASLAATFSKVVRRVAQLLATPANPVAVFRGDERLVQQTYAVPGEPTATLLIEQLPLALRRYQVSGQLIFDDIAYNTPGDFLLLYKGVPQQTGGVSAAGSFDLGTLSSGTYHLEITVQSQVVEVSTLQVGEG
jgi:hypothetical protein